MDDQRNRHDETNRQMQEPTPCIQDLPGHQRDPALHLLTAAQSHLPAILQIQRNCSNEVGFLPAQAIAQHIEQSHVRIVTLDSHVLGYLLGRLSLSWQPELSTITQIAVSRTSRRSHIGSMLLADRIAQSITAARIGIQACCLANLPANEFWRRNGFVCICYMSPKNARRRDVICWRLPLTRKIPLWFAAPPKRSGHHAQRPTIHVRQKRQRHEE